MHDLKSVLKIPKFGMTPDYDTSLKGRFKFLMLQWRSASSFNPRGRNLLKNMRAEDHRNRKMVLNVCFDHYIENKSRDFDAQKRNEIIHGVTASSVNLY